MNPSHRLRRASRREQHGATLLLGLLLAVTVAATYFANSLSGAAAGRLREEATARALAQAKEAIIAWSAANSSVPGRLPCPEDPDTIGYATEGTAYGSCAGSTMQQGRLPWRTLGLGRLTDGHGEPLWYAITPGFQDPPVNTDTPAGLTADGIASVAIVFSPGPPVGSQSRPIPTVSVHPNLTDYLEAENIDGNNVFLSARLSGVGNDQLMPISHRDLFAAVHQRVLGEVIAAIKTHFDHESKLPYPAKFDDASCIPANPALGTGLCAEIAPPPPPPSAVGRLPAGPWWPPASSILRGTVGVGPGNWFQKNGWREHVLYAVTDACTNSLVTCPSGSILLTSGPTTTVNRAAVIMAGAALPVLAQGRAAADKINPANYFEDANAALGSNYVRAPMTNTFNDVARGFQ